MQKGNKTSGNNHTLFKRARRLRDMSQEDVAKLFGVHQATISRFEKGQKIKKNIDKKVADFIAETRSKHAEEEVLKIVQASPELKALVERVIAEATA